MWTLFLIAVSALTPAAETTSQKAPLARIAALAGDWSLVDAQGEATDLRATYVVIAGGAAVMETLFAESPNETVTIYHQDGPRVTVTHLTARGAPVRLEDVDGADLTWHSGSESAKAGQLVGLSLVPDRGGKVRIEWSLASGNDATDMRAFDLRRDRPAAHLYSEVARMRVRLEALASELDRRMKHEVEVTRKGESKRALRETITSPFGAGWSVTGVPFRQLLHDQTVRYASTFAAEGDAGMTLAHYGFRAGANARIRFSALGGHAYVALVLDDKAPPRKIRSIPEFSRELLEGDYGPVIERVVGRKWKDYAAAIEWDLERFEGKGLRIYVVDAETNYYGQIAVSDFSIVEDAEN
ncbi:MAG: hypothetical protein GY711_04115 [bacterium]|nr:hypothetical protein [bacterium]